MPIDDLSFINHHKDHAHDKNMKRILADCDFHNFPEEITKRVFIRNGYTMEEIDSFLKDRK